MVITGSTFVSAPSWSFRVALVLSAALPLAFPPSASLASSAVWAADGLPIAPADGAQITPRIVSDHAGGAIIAWQDGRSGSFLAYAQRLNADGLVASEWPASGLLLPNRGLPQGNLAVVADDASGAFVASDDGGYAGVVMVHHLGHDGLPVPGWPSEVVMLQTASYGVPGGSQGAFLPALLPDVSGGVFVARTYRDRLYQSIALTRLTPSAGSAPGWPAGGIYAGELPGNPWEYPSALCSDGENGVFVAFQQNGIPSDLFVRRSQSDGTVVFPAPTRVSSSTRGQSAAGIASDGAGGAILVWQDSRNGLYEQTYAQRILGDGTYASGWPDTGLALSVHPTAPGISSDFVFPGSLSSAVADGTGGAFAAWTDYRDSTGSGEGDVYAQDVLGDGTTRPGWPVNGLAICVASGDQRLPTIVPDGSGGLFAAWQDRRGGSDWDIYALRVTGSGGIAAGWPAGGLAVCTSPGDQTAPVIALGSDGDAIIAWTDARSGIRQIYATLVSGAVTGIDALPTATFGLERVSPNPASGPFAIAFSLPDGRPATLELFDVSGRRVAGREVGSLGAGRHVVSLAETATLRAGVCLLRLSSGGRAIVTRVCILR